ncbi:hypothetical protein [Leisingera aquaemixtae]|uniref:hypothetical protein n=1 Tax=Leisingera aquaemixtae TaxID=1396826 RepID=UPI0021A6F137|nr:hypothetical protein [Leisingera aquaemixtae]UWQ44748.1 hypothetical protein K3719_13220 [Leisingera aquaemixtae]
MSHSVSNVDLGDFLFCIRIAKEKALEELGSEDPQVIATLAQTYATIATTRAVDNSQYQLREGLNYIIDALKEDE